MENTELIVKNVKEGYEENEEREGYEENEEREGYEEEEGYENRENILKEGFDSDDTTKFITDVFNKSNIIFIVWFLAIYFITYFTHIIFFSNESIGELSSQLRVSRMLDIFILGFTLIYLAFTFLNMSEAEKGNALSKYIGEFKTYMDDKMTLFSLIFMIIAFYLVIYILQIPMAIESKAVSITIIENILLILLLISVLVDFFKWILKLELLNLLLPRSLYKQLETTTATSITKVIKPKTGKEVFNIANNIYTYKDAKAVCSVYGARLATYDEIEQAYNDGAEWCNYGWSEGQMIFYPTQKSTWDDLQKDNKTKRKCGRPGVNGGYMKKSTLRFGVNCFGEKPIASDKEISKMNANKDIIVPKTKEEKALQAKVQFWKENADKLLTVNSFNRDKWSEY